MLRKDTAAHTCIYNIVYCIYIWKKACVIRGVKRYSVFVIQNFVCISINKNKVSETPKTLTEINCEIAIYLIV